MYFNKANKRALKTNVLTVDTLFDIEKLIAKNPELYMELCEKYPLKKECIYIIQHVQLEVKEEVSETPSVSEDVTTEPTKVSEAQPTEEVKDSASLPQVDIVDGEDYSQYNDVVEGPQAIITPPIEEVADDSYPEDFQPLYKASEHITIKYDYDKVTEKLTILMPMLITDDKKNPVNYKYKVVADGVGIKYYDEQFLVDHEVQQ